MTCERHRNEARHEIATDAMVTECAKARPSFQPRNPASTAPTSGENAAIQESVKRSMGFFFCWLFLAPRAAGLVSLRAYPFRLSRSATLIDLRLRNSATNIARPMADSAAATVRMKNT